jgi:hypothetical protein
MLILRETYANLAAVELLAWTTQNFAARVSVAALAVCSALTVAQVFVVASAAAQAWSVVPAWAEVLYRDSAAA